MKVGEKALQDRVGEIIKAINAVFGDTSVPRTTTRKFMEEISEAVEANIDALVDGVEGVEEDKDDPD
jgi:hypothetical protein